MYELLTGNRPFSGSSYEELMIAHLTRFAPPLSHLNAQVPRPVARLAEQALAKRPAERPSADTIRRALLTALGETPHDEVIDQPKDNQPEQKMGRHGPVAPRGPLVSKAPEPAPTEPKKEKGGWNPFKRKK